MSAARWSKVSSMLLVALAGRPPLPGGSREVLARVTPHFGLD